MFVKSLIILQLVALLVGVTALASVPSARGNYGPQSYPPSSQYKAKDYKAASKTICSLNTYQQCRNNCTAGGSCQPNSDGYFECFCNMICSTRYEPVCGSDGYTYLNQCELNISKCLNQDLELVKASDGLCKEDWNPKDGSENMDQ